MRPLSLSLACCTALFSLLLHAADPSGPRPEPGKASSPMISPTNLTPAEADSLIHSSKDVIVVDVRTQEEFAEGHIAGARNVNFNSPTFADQMKSLTGKKILLHCASGGRSTRALEVLSGMSFEKIYHLNKGFNAWVAAGKPVSTTP